MAIGGHFPEPELLRRNNAASWPRSAAKLDQGLQFTNLSAKFHARPWQARNTLRRVRGWDAAGARWFLTTLLDLRK
jgi:hypothetical protein